ncbi:BTB/POZ and MATH domain-containing protein 2 [Brachypodium distachyon]|uniref:BTB domain-containing protein n=1 Tax=Brachypodium distachyon TaxID=15368 RepID=A0A0Q3EFF0_BRADI|nr:BTB/POZ and MATH domain-containing protein 2 [Brachypodium distachyon]KQJ85084.1 hypothetical protein BRADI_5g24790v3 [Brachypodium distachyon]|eukprot:XP_010227324.1 BTB/POZ and MATH domain-containing protein 2 [Brachypodium distachyon]
MGAGQSVPADAAAAAATTASVSQIEKVTSIHEFTISEYSRTRGMGIGKSVLSQCFDVDGRRWYVRFYPDGYCTADAAWVAFYAQTLYKPQLRAVRAEFSFALLNADGDPVYTRRSDRACKYDTLCNSWGIRRFIGRNQLEAAALGAVHGDDSITVRCIVTVHKDRRRSLKSRRLFNRHGLPEAPPSCHAANFMRFLATGKAPFDVRFDLGGEVFEAHRMVVAAQSPWFESLLYGHGSESRSNTVEINADTDDDDAITPAAFAGVLYYIYHDELPDEASAGPKASAWLRKKAFEFTMDLFAAADYCLMKRMKLMCAGRLCEFLGEDNVEMLVKLAELHSCEELEQACRNYAYFKGISLVPRPQIPATTAPTTGTDAVDPDAVPATG